MEELAADLQKALEEDAGCPIREKRRKHLEANVGPSQATPPAKRSTTGERHEGEASGIQDASTMADVHQKGERGTGTSNDQQQTGGGATDTSQGTVGPSIAPPSRRVRPPAPPHPAPPASY
eukprot:8542792-Heterocapsa_arctica.AAC.1